jgi:hypothetical protein
VTVIRFASEPTLDADRGVNFERRLTVYGRLFFRSVSADAQGIQPPVCLVESEKAISNIWLTPPALSVAGRAVRIGG